MAISVVVLVSGGCHPVSGTPRACPGDVAAFEVARRLGGVLNVLHLGAGENETALNDYLAYGAQCVTVLAMDGSAVSSLAAHVAKYDLIVTGNRAETGACSGLLPYALASRLTRPIVANVLEASIADHEATVRQFLPKGKRRRIAVKLPAVLAVHPLAPVSPRYAYASKIQGRIERLAIANAIGGPHAMSVAERWEIDPTGRQLVRLKAEEKKAGHARMLSAVAAEARSGVVAIEGSDVEKAQMLLAYLREHRLIDF